MTYPITNTTNIFLRLKDSLYLLLDFIIYLISVIINMISHTVNNRIIKELTVNDSPTIVLEYREGTINPIKQRIYKISRPKYKHKITFYGWRYQMKAHVFTVIHYKMMSVERKDTKYKKREPEPIILKLE